MLKELGGAGYRLLTLCWFLAANRDHMDHICEHCIAVKLISTMNRASKNWKNLLVSIYMTMTLLFESNAIFPAIAIRVTIFILAHRDLY